jgi:hypothetical protein
MFQTIPTAMNHVLLDDVTEMGRTIIFGMVLNIFQTIAPADIRQVFINNIDTINENNALLTKFFNEPTRKAAYDFDPTNPKYAIYFNQYSWGDLTEFQSYMIEARCTTEMDTFHRELEEALNKEEEKEHKSYIPPPQPNAQPKPPPISATGIVKALLRIMGMLSTKDCKETLPLIDNVIKLITGKDNKEEVGQLQSAFDEFKGMIPAKKASSNNAVPSPISDMLSTAFTKVAKKVQNTTAAVRGKVDTMMPKQSQWREKLEQLQKQVANMEEHLSLLPQIQTVEKQIQTTQAKINAAQQGMPPIVSNGKDQSQALASAPLLAPALPPVQPFVYTPGEPDSPPNPQSSSGSAGGSRKKGRTRRIRASTRALRQRARE